MTYSPIPKGTQNWDVPLNAALAQLDANITSGSSAALQAANNLSDLTNVIQARNNLQISQGYVAGVNQFNVKDYGALGNGTADDTAAIQATLNAANAIGGAVVYMPPGTYKISSALTMYSHITLIGAGDFVTNITQTSTSAHGLVGDSLIYVTIKSLRLTGPSSGTGEGIAFTTEFDYCILEDITVTNWGSTGIDIEQPIVSNFTRVQSRLNGGAGMYIHGTGLGAGTSISLDSCWMHDNTSNGYSFFNMTYCAFVACAADNQTVSGKAGYLIDTCSGFSFSGCGSENNNIGMKFTGIGNHTVQGFFNYANPSGGIGFYATGSVGNLHLMGIAESTPNGAATNWIKTDTGTTVTVRGSVHTTANSFAANTVVSMENVAGTSVVSGNVANGANTLLGSTTALGDNGVGVTQIANATTVPTTNPSGGVTVYAESTADLPLKFRDPAGNVRSVADGRATSTSNQTTTSNVQQASTQLVVGVQANATYIVDAVVLGNTPSGTNFTHSWTGPTGATMVWGDTTRASQATITTVDSWTSAGADLYIMLKGVLITSSTAGNLTVTFASGTNGNTATLKANSFVRVTRIK